MYCACFSLIRAPSGGSEPTLQGLPWWGHPAVMEEVPAFILRLAGCPVFLCSCLHNIVLHAPSKPVSFYTSIPRHHTCALTRRRLPLFLSAPPCGSQTPTTLDSLLFPFTAIPAPRRSLARLLLLLQHHAIQSLFQTPFSPQHSSSSSSSSLISTAGLPSFLGPLCSLGHVRLVCLSSELAFPLLHPRPTSPSRQILLCNYPIIDVRKRESLKNFFFKTLQVGF